MQDSTPPPLPVADQLHGLPPILPDGRPRALILGSFPSVRSLAAREYYAHPQNWFWRVMQHCAIIPDASATYPTRISHLKSSGLAVWDLYASVRREGSADDRIHDTNPNPIPDLIAAHDPLPILLNGRRTREFRRAFPNLHTEPIALPSTSPRPLHWNTKSSRAAALKEWQAALHSTINRDSLSK